MNDFNLFVEIGRKVYFIWNCDNEKTTLIDRFIIVNEMTLIATGIEFDAIGTRSKVPEYFIESIEGFYQRKGNFPKINPKQLLTHENKYIREFIKSKINESISSY